MLITFKTKSYADITMFGDVALKLIKIMGHSGTVPGALGADEVADALERLRKAAAEDKKAQVRRKDQQRKENERKQERKRKAAAAVKRNLRRLSRDNTRRTRMY